MLSVAHRILFSNPPLTANVKKEDTKFTSVSSFLFAQPRRRRQGDVGLNGKSRLIYVLSVKTAHFPDGTRNLMCAHFTVKMFN